MSDALLESNRLILKQSYGYSRPALRNVEHTSFMNASIQALFACEQFRVYVILISNEYPEIDSYKYFSDLFIRMVRGKDVVIPLNTDPQQITREEDPSTFLTQVIDMIIDDYHNISVEFWFPSKYPCPTDVFVSRIEVICNSCQHSKWKIENNWMTTFRINAWNLDTISIKELYQNFIENNYFSEKPIEMCKNCNCYMILKTFETPNILMLRLEYNELEDWIIRPKLNIEHKMVINNREYNLFACICREKIQTEDEYYCCFVKYSHTWYYFNDSTVKEIYDERPSEYQLNTAYLLFYKKLPNDIQTRFLNEVDLLIPPIQTIPQFFYEHNQKSQSEKQLKPAKYDPKLPDLISHSLGENRGLHNITGICFMSAALQALFHCEPFRLHILSEWHSGRFHTQLRLLFKAIADNTLPLINIYQHFYNSFCLNVRKEFGSQASLSRNFLSALMFELNDEVKRCSVRYEEMNPNVSFSNKPMTSTDAWIQFLIAQKNSYLVRMFTIQRNIEQYCLNGHCYSYFRHSLIETLMVPQNYHTNYIDIQMILDSPTETQMKIKYCSKCSQLVSSQFSQISRVSDVLIFELELNEDNSQNPDMCPNTSIHLNEQITVCAQKYYCRAILVGQELSGFEIGHAFTYAKIANNWYCYDDRFVRLVSSDCMLNEKCYKGFDRYVELVFYEKLSPTVRSLTLNEQQLLQSIQWPQQQTPFIRTIKKFCSIQ